MPSSPKRSIRFLQASRLTFKRIQNCLHACIDPVRGEKFNALFVLLLVLVLSESAQADERYSYSTSVSIASQRKGLQLQRPARSRIGIAGVRLAIEYEYEQEYEEFGLRRLMLAQMLNEQR
jgi:hypothetical protein